MLDPKRQTAAGAGKLARASGELGAGRVPLAGNEAAALPFRRWEKAEDTDLCVVTGGALVS